MRIDELLAQIRAGNEGPVPLDATRFKELYERSLQFFNSSPVITIVQTDSLLICQFSEYARLRILIEDKRHKINESDFSYIEDGKLIFIDVTGHKQSFLSFFWNELRTNIRWLVLLVVVFLFAIISLSTLDTLSNLFTVVSQVVSVFTAVYIVFTTVQAPRGRHDLSLFSEGYLADYHRDDKHFTTLAVITIFVSLFGTLIVKTQSSLFGKIEIGSFHISFNLVSTMIDAVALLELIGLAILFLSLPQYYFKRSKQFLFSDLTHELLDSYYQDYHHDEKLITIRSSDTPPLQS